MFLDRFRKPKWQHPDPHIRTEAVKALNAADPILAQIAREDENPGVRRVALSRITDLGLLRTIAAEDPEAGVRDTADARFRRLLTGKEPDSAALKRRLALLGDAPSAELAAFLLAEGAEPELRLAALSRVDQNQLLETAAINDPALEVRLAALARIQGETALEHIVQETRKRDKRVHRLARERLSALRTEREQREHARQTCEAMQTLSEEAAAAGEREPDLGRLSRIEHAWEKLEPAAAAEFEPPYRQAREQFQKLLEARAVRRGERREIFKTLETFGHSLEQADELSEELEASFEQTLQDAQSEWNRCGEAERSEQRRFDELVQTIEKRERVLHRNRERAERLRQVLAEADALLHQPGAVQEADITHLNRLWKTQERPETKDLAANLQSRFEAALDRLRARLQRQEETRDQERAEIEQLIEECEQALAQGLLQHAIVLRDQARQRLKQNIGLPRKEMHAMEHRLHACMPKMDELRDWRRWGTNQARDGLCAEAESLIGDTDDPRRLAERIKQLRAAWKSLDSNIGPAPKPLWSRFNETCKQAYAPCQAYFDDLARQRRETLEKRQALCEQIEYFEAATDWAQADWRQADRLLRETKVQWRKLGPIGRGDQRTIERRFNKALKRLDTHLLEERQRELERRQALIRRVEALVESDDLHLAIESAKQAQAEWPPSVQAERRQEQALWREFRAACDAVFERRQAEREAFDTERQANLASKTALCQEIEALIVKDEEALDRARSRLRQIREAWESIGPVPKTAYKDIEKRFANACADFERRDRECRREQARRELQNLREHARLCARLEALLAAAETDDSASLLDRTRQTWDELPPLPEALMQSIRLRFEAACLALTEGGAARQSLQQDLEKNLDKKKNLCLGMEILAGIDSPPEFAQARMEYQVARLSESLNARDIRPAGQNKSAEASQIEREWHLTGALPAELNADLETRFERALTALHKPAAT